MSTHGVTSVKEVLLPMMNNVSFLHEGLCTNFLSVSVISCALCVRSSNVKGRRMGGNSMSTLERICAQCQGKMARFEIVRIKDFNFYKKATSTHTHTLYFFNTTTHSN